MERRDWVFYLLLGICVGLGISLICYGIEVHDLSQQYKLLEATYAADTTDRGNTERKLTEIINKR